VLFVHAKTNGGTSLDAPIAKYKHEKGWIAHTFNSLQLTRADAESNAALTVRRLEGIATRNDLTQIVEIYNLQIPFRMVAADTELSAARAP